LPEIPAKARYALYNHRIFSLLKPRGTLRARQIVPRAA